MAQPRQRRRRKRRGTQGGRIDTRPARGRPRSREEAKARARARRSGAKKSGGKRTVDRRDQPPTWSGAVNRALFAAAIFLVSVLLLFHQPIATTIPLAVLMMAIYIPLGHAIDNYFYKRRQAQLQRARQQRK
jgi:Flp pilus assembly protein TadB